MKFEEHWKNDKYFKDAEGRKVRIYALDGGNNEFMHGAYFKGNAWFERWWHKDGKRGDDKYAIVSEWEEEPSTLMVTDISEDTLTLERMQKVKDTWNNMISKHVALKCKDAEGKFISISTPTRENWFYNKFREDQADALQDAIKENFNNNIEVTGVSLIKESEWSREYTCTINKLECDCGAVKAKSSHAHWCCTVKDKT